MTRQEQVKEFMVKAGQECPKRASVPPPEVRALRVRLIAEELAELAGAGKLSRSSSDYNRVGA